MKSFFISRARSFYYAFRGWWHVIRTQQNAWVHAIASTLVLILGLWLRLPPQDWAVLLMTIAMVWAAEFFNTAIEAVADLASPANHPLAEVGKDVGAAAVLIAALAAIGVGVLILGPPLWEKVQVYFNDHLSASCVEEIASIGLEWCSWQTESCEWQGVFPVHTIRIKNLAEVQEAPLYLQKVKETIVRFAV